MSDFDFSDLGRRWALARRAALSLAGASDEDSEVRLLVRVPADSRDRVLRAVFDNSRKLALSLSRHLSLTFELGDFQKFFSVLPVPCLTGQWEVRSGARVLRRSGCDAGREAGAFACDFYREAMDGIVMGLGEEERYARHESVGHGGADCVDVFFLDGAQKWAPVPFEVLGALAAVDEDYSKRGYKLYWDGFSENTLFYRLEPGKGVLCGTVGRAVHESFRKRVLEKLPQITLQDAGPLAVYGEGTR